MSVRTFEKYEKKSHCCGHFFENTESTKLTHEQRAWLVAHPTYEPIGVAGNGVVWTCREKLLPNGSLASSPTDDPLIAVELPPLWLGGPFPPIEVGVRKRVG